MTFYGLGLGPGGWLIPSEIFATSIRAKGMSVATFMNRAVATLMVATFLIIEQTLTWPIFVMILAGVTAFTLVMLYIYLPETKGRTLEDMSLYFAEITGDFSILDAEQKLRVEGELRRMKDGKKSSSDPSADMTEAASETETTGASSSGRYIT